MPPVVPISVVILARNEVDRIHDAIASASWASEVLVADTGSTDGTVELARRDGARVIEIPWEGFVASRNRAQASASNDWVFFLDADERFTSQLRADVEAALAAPDDRFAGYRMPRLSHLMGRAVRHGTWYPDAKLRLGRRSRGLRTEGGRVHELCVVDGPVGWLPSPLVHHPYRDLSDSVRKAASYARLGADDRYERGARGSVAGLFVRPAFEFFRCFVIKLGFLDGSAGFAVALLHAASYFLRAAFLLERAGRE